MDFSQAMNGKITIPGEINNSPVPARVSGIMKASGLTIDCYYENITSHRSNLDAVRVFPYYCISHLFKGDGFFLDHDTGQFTELTPGMAVIVTPGKRMNYGLHHKYYTEDSICFSGSTADALKYSGIISDGVVNIGNERRLLPIINKLREVAISSLFEANLMLQKLLIELHRERIRLPESMQSKRLKRLLRELNQNPEKWWTVQEMAEYCNISANYLRTMFLRETGMTPKVYVDQLKVTRASELLTGSDMKISDVAAALGYSDHYYFIRRFTGLKKISPGKYRKMYSHTGKSSYQP